MSQPLLVHISYSPWSLKARLALDLAGLAHERREYLSVVHEPWLRARTGRWTGKVTIPVMITPRGSLDDSLSIAAAVLKDTPLWPDDQAVRAWDAWSESLLSLGRLHTTHAVADDAEALRASLPGFARKLGPVGMLVGRAGVSYLLAKYPQQVDDLVGEMAPLLAQLDDALDGRRFLVGDRLSYADVSAAVGLSFVQAPMALRLEAASRRHWQVPALADAHPGLLRWRDRVLQACAEQAASVGR